MKGYSVLETSEVDGSIRATPRTVNICCKSTTPVSLTLHKSFPSHRNTSQRQCQEGSRETDRAGRLATSRRAPPCGILPLVLDRSNRREQLNVVQENLGAAVVQLGSRLRGVHATVQLKVELAIPRHEARGLRSKN